MEPRADAACRRVAPLDRARGLGPAAGAPHRLIVDTILCLLTARCARRLVSTDLARWSTTYRAFAAWTRTAPGRIHDTLRDPLHANGRIEPRPAEAVLGLQPVRKEGDKQIGYDVGKRVRDRTRHLLVDTLGLMLAGLGHRPRIARCGIEASQRGGPLPGGRSNAPWPDRWPTPRYGRRSEHFVGFLLLAAG